MTCWTVEPLQAEIVASLERLRDAPDVVRVALMPDVRLANEVCVRTALATRRYIYPAAIGSDIGCGAAAVRFRAVPFDAASLASSGGSDAFLIRLRPD